MGNWDTSGDRVHGDTPGEVELSRLGSEATEATEVVAVPCEVLHSVVTGAHDPKVLVAVEGDTTALYLARLLKPQSIKITRLASGVPMGGELEYLDQATVGRALSERREF